MEKNVIYKKQGDIGNVILNKPDKYNTLDIDTLKELIAAFQESKEKEDICVIYSAKGKHFTVGADLKYSYNLLNSPERIPEAVEFLESFQDLTRAMLDHPGIIIAGLHGWVIGGGFEQLLGCDIRIAAEDTRIMLPELGAGLFFSNASTKLLPRIVGEGNAKYLMLLGDEINAEEALRIGLVSKICKTTALNRILKKMANKITQKSHLAIKYTKDHLNYNQDLGIEAVLARETIAMRKTGQSDELKKRLKMFVEERH